MGVSHLGIDRTDRRGAGAVTNVGRRRQSPRGQAMVEFALVVPIILVLLMSVLDFGRAIYAYNTISGAARSGVRIAVVNQNAPGTGCAGGDQATPLDSTKVSATDCAISHAVALGTKTTDVTVAYRDYTDSDICRAEDGTPKVEVGCLAVVTVNYQFHAITPVIGSLLGTINMSSTTKQSVEFVCPKNAAPICVPK